MSDALNGSVAPFCHSQNHSGSVPVPTIGVSAVGTQESSFAQSQPLVSRKAGAARHCRVGGLDHHHRPACPLGILDKGPLHGADRIVGSLAGHRGLSEELRLEVLDSDGLVVGNDLPRPCAAFVSVSALSLPRGLRGTELGALVTLALLVSSWPSAARHLTLRLGEFCGGSVAVSQVWEIVLRASGRSGSRHAPVDTDSALYFGKLFPFTAHNERGIPVAKAVPVDTHRGRLGRKLSRPDDRDRHALRQYESTIPDGEPALGVLQARRRAATRLHGRSTSALDLERVPQRLIVGAQHLLLRHLGPFPEPRRTRTSSGQFSTQHLHGRTMPVTLKAHALVPEPPAAMPFVSQRAQSCPTRPQPVGVAHRLFHDIHYTALRYIMLAWLRSGQTTTSSIAAPSTSSGAQNIGDQSSLATWTTDSNSSSPTSVSSAAATSSNSKPCPTMFISWSSVTPSTESIGWSNRSRGDHPVCSDKSSHTSSPGSPRSGPTPTSSPQSAAQPSKSLSSTSPISGTCSRPYLPTAKAGGFSGGI